MPTAQPITPAEFHAVLEDIVTRELRIWQLALSSETMRAFDVGCFPWHGYLELSFLTLDETPTVTRTDPYTRIANWRLYNFASTRDSAVRQQREHLGNRMRKTLDNSENGKAVIESFLRTTALVVTSQAVRDELQKFHRTADFAVTVFDPDNYDRGNLVATG